MLQFLATLLVGRAKSLDDRATGNGSPEERASWIPLFDRILQRMPPECRTALRLETLSSLAGGAYLVTFQLALVVQTILAAPTEQMALLATFFFGSSLFSPLVTYAARFVPMRWLVVVPNVVVAAVLLLVAVPGTSPLFFTLVVGTTFVLRVFPRAAEMNMFRVLYPATHRGTAIGWTRAMGALASLLTTFLGWFVFATFPQWYAVVFVYVAAMLAVSATFYARIPVPADAPPVVEGGRNPVAAFARGVVAFVSDRRFLAYQIGFAIAGIANHMALWYVPDVLRDEVGASETVISLVVAVLPTFFLIAAAPVWGRLLDGLDPMAARGIFNGIQVLAFGFYGLGGMLGAVWPFVIGTMLHAVGNAGGIINWLTGSMYFAKAEHVSLYNGIHVCLTGVRGIVGPLAGFLLAAGTTEIGGVTIHGAGLGWRVFLVAAGLSLAGVLWMLVLRIGDPGPRDEVASSAS